MSEENMNKNFDENGEPKNEVKKENFLKRGAKATVGFFERNWKFFVGVGTGIICCLVKNTFFSENESECEVTDVSTSETSSEE